MATATLLPFPRAVFYDANGKPLAGGSVATYVPGGTTPKTTWQNSTETAPNENPITLDADGSCLLYGAGSYQFAVTDAQGNQVPAYSGITIDSLTNAAELPTLIPPVATISALQLATSISLPQAQCFVLGYAASADGGEGTFVYIPGDTSSSDNGGTIIVDASGRRWYREFEGNEVAVTWFGADWSGTNDATTACQNALNASLAVKFPGQHSGAQAVYKISSELGLRAGHLVRGHGRGATSLEGVTANIVVMGFGPASLTLANICISDMTIQGAAASVIGVAFTLCTDTTIRNVQFLGCSGSAISVDRGYYHLVENCVSRPTSSYKAGSFVHTSTSDTDHCYYPTLRDCKVHGEDEAGLTTGAASPCVYWRRVIGGRIDNFVGERLNAGGGLVTGIILENDTEGVKITGGVTYGATYGVLLQVGGGVASAPGYVDIISHDVDYFSLGGIYINGSSSATCADVTIIGGQITAPQGASVPCIYVNEVLKSCASAVVMDDYTASHSGKGIVVSNNAVLTISDCRMSFLNVGFSVGSSASQVFAVNNEVTDTTTPLEGASNLIGSTSRLNANRGVNPINVTAPSVPASGTSIFNTTGTDVMVYVSGGTNVNASVGPTNLGTASGPYYVAANNSISLSYSAAPTWAWAPI